MGTTYTYRIVHPGHQNDGMHVDYAYRLRDAKPEHSEVRVNDVDYREADIAGGHILVPLAKP